MAARVKLDIPMYQGETRGYRFSLFTDAEQTQEWDITGATDVTLSIKKTLDQDDALISVEATDGSDGSDFANGIVVFVLDGADTALLNRDGKYDVFVTLGGDPISPVHGDVILDRAVKPLP